MGTWGPSFDEDDLAADVYAAYVEAYDAGTPHPKILAKLRKEWGNEIEERADAASFWIAVAKAQWECGALTAATKATVTRAITCGDAVAGWDVAEKRELAQRNKSLAIFLAKLDTPNPRPRKSRKPVAVTPALKPGDCVAVELSKNDWGAFVVLKDPAARPSRGASAGDALLAVLRYRAAEPPTSEVFGRREWLVVSRYGLPRRPFVTHVLGRKDYKQVQDRLKVVGSIRLLKSDPDDELAGAMADWGVLLREMRECCPKPAAKLGDWK